MHRSTPSSLALVLIAACAEAPTIQDGTSSPELGITGGTLFVPPCTSNSETLAKGICRGEDWWLPDDVLQSSEGQVTIYGRAIVDETVEDPTDGWNAYSRNVTGFTTNTKMKEWRYDATADEWVSEGIWNPTKMLAQHGESDCIAYCEEQQVAEVHEDNSWTEALVTAAGYDFAPWLRPTYDASVNWGLTDCEEALDTTWDVHTAYSPYIKNACSEDACANFERRRWSLSTFMTETGTNFGTDNLTTWGIDSWSDVMDAWCEDVHGYTDCIDGIRSSSHTSTADITNDDTFEAIASYLGAIYSEVADVDAYGIFGNLEINGETATYPYYHDAGLITTTSTATSLTTFDELVEAHRPLWEESGIPTEHLMVSIGMGGIEVVPWVEAAKDPRGDGSYEDPMGLASHGPVFLTNYRALQHLDHIEYDEDRKAFVATRDHDFAFLHTDLENLDHTPDTFGQYRFFRMAGLAGLAYRFDSLLVTAQTIPAVGRIQDEAESCDTMLDSRDICEAAYAASTHVDFDVYRDQEPYTCGFYDLCHDACRDDGYDADGDGFLSDAELEACKPAHPAVCQTRCENFDYSALEDENADDFLHWMTQTVGREDPVEAWCAPYDIGTDGGVFADLVLTTADAALRWETDASVYRPLQRFYGSHCTISSDNPGTAGIPLAPDWVGGAQYHSGVDLGHKLLTGVQYGTCEASDTSDCAHEGRKPSADGITFEIDTAVLTQSDNVRVRVVFTLDEDVSALHRAKLTVGFDRRDSDKLRLDTIANLAEGTIYTADFALEVDGSTDITVNAVAMLRDASGTLYERATPLDLNVLMVRVIPVD